MSDSALYRSKDTLRGVFLVVVVAVVAGAAWVFSRPQVEGPVLYTEYDQVFGLSQGDPVTLNGLQVGVVEDITTEFLDRGGVRFQVSLRLSEDLRGPADSLLLNRGTQAAIVPPALPFLGGAQIRLLTDFEAVGRLVDGDQVASVAGTVLLDELGAQARQLAESVQQATADLSSLMASVETTRSEMDRTLRTVRAEVPAMTAMLRGRMMAVDSLVASANAEISATGPEVRELLDSLTLLAGQTRELVTSVDETVQDRVPDVDLVLARLDSASFIANHLVQRISENPLRVLWGVDVPDSIPTRRDPGG